MSVACERAVPAGRVQLRRGRRPAHGGNPWIAGGVTPVTAPARCRVPRAACRDRPWTAARSGGRRVIWLSLPTRRSMRPGEWASNTAAVTSWGGAVAPRLVPRHAKRLPDREDQRRVRRRLRVRAAERDGRHRHLCAVDLEAELGIESRHAPFLATSLGETDCVARDRSMCDRQTETLEGPARGRVGGAPFALQRVGESPFWSPCVAKRAVSDTPAERLFAERVYARAVVWEAVSQSTSCNLRVATISETTGGC